MAANSPNCFWKCCLQIIRVSRLIPVLVVLGIIIFSYYVFVFQTVPSLTSQWLYRGLIYIAFHILLFMFLCSYFVTIMTKVPKIPIKYYLPEDVFVDFVNEKTDQGRNAILYRYMAQHNIVVQHISGSDGPRFCGQCRCIKPDRSHHCSMCGTCVLRYDHHCPWVNNCIHSNNYKAFLLFLFYGLVLCLFVLAISLPSFIVFWNGHPMSNEIVEKFSMVFLPFIAFLFGLSISCLFFYHIYLVCRNRTTIEQWLPPTFEDGPNANAYNLGCANNFKQIFGDSKLYWLVPIYTSTGNGLTYTLPRRRMENLRLLDCELSSSDEEFQYGRRVLSV